MQPIEAFISYAHEDEKLCHELLKHLGGLRQQGLIGDWHDREILPGQEWAEAIDENLNSAGLILLMISADFIASHYCSQVEVPRALARHEAGEAVVIPVILRPCDWQSLPFGKIQALPTDGKPITRWGDREEALLDVAQGIRRAVAELIASRTPAPGGDHAEAHAPRSNSRPPLIFFCDRSEQETELHLALDRHRREQPRRPFVCLVHGDEYEAHGEFLERLQNHKLPRFLNLDRMAVKDYEWNPPSSHVPSPERLWRSLGDVLSPEAAKSQAEVMAIIARHEEPLMINTLWLTEDFEARGEALLAQFLEFWRHWPDLLSERMVMNFVCLKYRRVEAAGLLDVFSRKGKRRRLNERLREFVGRQAAASSQDFSLAVLPELQAISGRDAQVWSDNEDVQRLYRVQARDIRELYKRYEDSPIAMDKLAEEIEQLRRRKLGLSQA